MQMAGGIAQGQQQVLYVSAEESVSQTGLRAQRLGIRSERVKVASESDLEQIIVLTKNERPGVLIVDSIQTVFLPELSSAPGTVAQVRECAARLMGLAKGIGITVFLIGHVTKEGNIAGPKVLEHMVDTVLSFEGDMSHQFRILRALKNRFGATHELGVFQMIDNGLKEVSNPSELFLEERGENLIGSVVFSYMEGTRPLLCEVQALSSYSPLSIPRRTSIGFDVNRVHLLVGILSKHLGIDFSHADIFINVVGGLKIDEPAADLAVVAALLSSEGHQEIPVKSCFFGEVGLTGEIRAVSHVEQRVQEAKKLGFENFVLPASNRKHLSKIDPKTNFIWIENLHQLTNFLATSRNNSPKAVERNAPAPNI
jgi:DNA repair protein RadA/Sms